MCERLRKVILFVFLGSLLLSCRSAAPAPAQGGSAAAAASPAAGQPAGPTRVTVGVTETLESQNPYADSVALGYAVWCEVLGCLLSYDFGTGDYTPSLAESWEVENPTTWVFHLRKDVTWHDGSPFTAADVVHSVHRIQQDPESKQKWLMGPVSAIEALDDYTVRMTTKAPTASLLSYFANLLVCYESERRCWPLPLVGRGRPRDTGTARPVGASSRPPCDTVGDRSAKIVRPGSGGEF